MKVSWVVLFNRLFEIIDQPGKCYFSGPRFISKIREIDPYFPDYHQYINERNKAGKNTNRKSYFYDILLSFRDEDRIHLLDAILKDTEGVAEKKTSELRGLIHGITFAPSATVHPGAWNADRLNAYLSEIDNCIAASNYTRAVTLSYTCLEGLYKAFVKENIPGKSGLKDILDLSREIKKCLSTTLKDYPDEALALIGSISHMVDRARNKFSESHFEGEAAKWLAMFVRDLVNSQIRLLLHFMKS
ncbi:MAG: hypothetical protein E8D42_11065 [Nitrospira sp.]|nr:MAG: hypothetical protein E8D42_11065 [Nitrospira sp.]